VPYIARRNLVPLAQSFVSPLCWFTLTTKPRIVRRQLWESVSAFLFHVDSYGSLMYAGRWDQVPRRATLKSTGPGTWMASATSSAFGAGSGQQKVKSWHLLFPGVCSAYESDPQYLALLTKFCYCSPSCMVVEFDRVDFESLTSPSRPADGVRGWSLSNERHRCRTRFDRARFIREQSTISCPQDLVKRISAPRAWDAAQSPLSP
jgi:hypothetical protein